MNRENGERRIMIKGLVIPVDWDQAGNVRTIAVLTDDEGEYQVVPAGVGDQLTVHLRSEILADAVLMDATGPAKRVRVDSYAILDWRGADDWVAAGRM